MSASLTLARVGDWDAYELANSALHLVVVPALGGKVVSLRSATTGREWLWRNPHLELRAATPDAQDYGSHDFGGWDEVFPTITPCRLPDTAWGEQTLTDHGELWRRSGEVIDERVDADGSASLTMRCDLPDFGVCFTRELTLPSGTAPLTCSYNVENRSDRLAPYLWAAHPLMSIRPGDRWELPEGTRVRLGLAIDVDAAEGDFRWPHLPLKSGGSLNLRTVPSDEAAFALKLFAVDVDPAVAALVGEDGTWLRLSQPDAEVSCFALWLNYGGWSGADCPAYFNAGFEPTNAPYDNVADAAQTGHAATLPPRGAHRWRLLVDVR